METTERVCVIRCVRASLTVECVSGRGGFDQCVFGRVLFEYSGGRDFLLMGGSGRHIWYVAWLVGALENVEISGPGPVKS